MSESGHPGHVFKLKRLCRLCGCVQKDKDPLQSKDKYTRIIAKACGIDITTDSINIHPPGICSGCRLKLKKYQSDLNIRRSANHSIIVTEFKEHTALYCDVCEQQIDLHALAETGRAAGCVPTMLPEALTLTKLNNNGTHIQCYVIIKHSGIEKLVVGCRDVTIHHCQVQNPSEVNHVIDIFLNWNVCPGNLGFEDVIELRRKKGEIVVVFRDHNKDNIEVAREDSDASVRHVDCQGFYQLTEGDLERCISCYKHRAVLRSIRSREGKEKQQVHPQSHARHDLLDSDRLQDKIKLLQGEKRSLKRQLSTTETMLQAVVHRDSVEIPEKLSKDFKQIIIDNKKSFEEGSLQQIFWQQQEQCLGRAKQGYRWHPAVIRLCIALHAKSTSAYRTLSESGVLIMPSSKTLKDYTYFTTPCAGFNPAVLQRIAQDHKLDTLPEFRRNVVLVFDEIHVRQGLVYSAGTDELLGWMDMGDINNEIADLSREGGEQPLASQILCFMVRGLFLKLNEVFAFFPSTGYTAHQMYFTAWKAVLLLEEFGFHVRAMTCDGAASNRKFFKLHSRGEDITYSAPHPTRDEENIYFVCDVPHLIKTTRNCWENSGWNSKSRYLEYNNQPILWTQLLQLVKDGHPNLPTTEHQAASHVPDAILTSVWKLTPQHLYLTPSLRMKVKLATQVLSDRVKKSFLLHPTLREQTKSTQFFIGMMDKFFDCLNVRRKGQDQRTKKPELAPYCTKQDWRLQWLMQEFLGFLNDWEMQSMAKPNCTKKDKSRLCLSRETLEGLRITVNSFVRVTRELLEEKGVKYVLSSKFNQDPLEQYFSKQRSLGGAMENPDVRRFGYNYLTLLAAGSSAVRAAAHGNTLPEEQVEIVSTPMQRRQ